MYNSKGPNGDCQPPGKATMVKIHGGHHDANSMPHRPAPKSKVNAGRKGGK